MLPLTSDDARNDVTKGPISRKWTPSSAGRGSQGRNISSFHWSNRRLVFEQGEMNLPSYGTFDSVPPRPRPEIASRPSSSASGRIRECQPGATQLSHVLGCFSGSCALYPNLPCQSRLLAGNSQFPHGCFGWLSNSECWLEN